MAELKIKNSEGVWIPLESLKGADGLTPYIGANGHWFIGETDTGVNASGPKGDEGTSGVYVGTTAPTNPNTNVWINPNGTYSFPVTDVKIDGVSVVTNGVANLQGLSTLLSQLPDAATTTDVVIPVIVNGATAKASRDQITQKTDAKVAQLETALASKASSAEVTQLSLKVGNFDESAKGSLYGQIHGTTTGSWQEQEDVWKQGLYTMGSSGQVVGETFTGRTSTTSANKTNYRYAAIDVNEGEKFKVFVIAYSKIMGLAIVDSDGITRYFSYSANSLENGKEIIMPCTGKMYINHYYRYNDVDNDGFKVEKYVETTTGGVYQEINAKFASAKQYTDQKLSQIAKTYSIDCELQPNNSVNISSYIATSLAEGCYRFKMVAVSNVASGITFRVFKSNGTINADYEITRNIPIGKCVDTYIRGEFSGIYVYAGNVGGSAKVRFTAERLDTDEVKSLKNENILVFGDSISAFSAGGTLGREALRWVDIFKALNPSIELTNLAVGGTRLRRGGTLSLTPSSETKAFQALSLNELVKGVTTADFDWQYQDAAATYLVAQNSGYSYITNVVAAAKLVDISKVTRVIIMGGTNDWGADDGASLGTTDSTDETTSLGALNVMITSILAANPKIKIHIFGEPVRYKSNTRSDDNWSDNYKAMSSNQTLKEFFASVAEVCDKRNTPFTSLSKNLGWNQTNFSQFFIDTDSTHPYKGFREIAEVVTKALFYNVN